MPSTVADEGGVPLNDNHFGFRLRFRAIFLMHLEGAKKTYPLNLSKCGNPSHHRSSTMDVQWSLQMHGAIFLDGDLPHIWTRQNAGPAARGVLRPCRCSLDSLISEIVVVFIFGHFGGLLKMYQRWKDFSGMFKMHSETWIHHSWSTVSPRELGGWESWASPVKICVVTPRCCLIRWALLGLTFEWAPNSLRHRSFVFFLMEWGIDSLIPWI